MNQFTAIGDPDFYQVLADTAGVSIVFFTKHGCSSCAAWRRVLTELQQQQPGVHLFEVDTEQNMALAQEYEIFHLPALFVFVDGEYHAPLLCEARLPVISSTLSQLLAKPAVEAP